MEAIRLLWAVRSPHLYLGGFINIHDRSVLGVSKKFVSQKRIDDFHSREEKVGLKSIFYRTGYYIDILIKIILSFSHYFVKKKTKNCILCYLLLFFDLTFVSRKSQGTRSGAYKGQRISSHIVFKV